MVEVATGRKIPIWRTSVFFQTGSSYLSHGLRHVDEIWLADRLTFE